ncbi:hypothetical protein [Flavobacterium sp.]|uniref:hypothetical protein n=1 Tax=Flavobacterium sp. TaxID=239 RepID=UPI00286E675B|nr:hypothetical protein [Flavobacterium sp.]
MGLFLNSCEKEFEETRIPEDKKQTNNKTASINARTAGVAKGEEIILGKKLLNAYSVETMQSAFDFYNNMFPEDSQFLGIVVQATHQYIKITPSTEQDLIALEEIANNNEEIVLHKHPLDYQIIQQGSDYNDPNYAGEAEYKPLYTSIPAGYDLNLPYEVLDNLYKPTDNENDIETIAMVLSDWQDELQADFGKPVSINDIRDVLAGPNPSQRLIARKFLPIGAVQMHLTDTNGLEGLKSAKLNIGRYFWWSHTYTNEVGFYVGQEYYRGNVNIRSVWRNYTATLRMSGNEMLGIDVSDHIMTMNAGNVYTNYLIFNQHSDQRLWYKGAVHNGLHKYLQYTVANGVLPVAGANIWVWKTGNGAASTPMFHKMNTIPLLSQFSGMSPNGFFNTFYHNVIRGPLLGSVALLLPHLMPDQIYTSLDTKSTITTPQSNRVIEQLVFHESSHFSHALKCGAINYSKIVSAEMINTIDYQDPYYNGVSPTVAAGQQIALAEGWATYLENRCMQHYYNYSFERNSNNPISPNVSEIKALPSYMETFTMFQTPFTLFSQRRDNKNFFLSGLLWDLTDTSSNETDSYLFSGSGNQQLSQIIDNVSVPSTPLSIYYLLGSDIYTASDLKTRLLLTYPAQSTNIKTIFRSYGL